jgi:hypothetical protein
MVAKTSASRMTGHHCCQVNLRKAGRPDATSTTAATHWRTATTPAGPIAGNARAPVAAPSWLDSALPSIIVIPESGSVPAGRSPAACSVDREVVITRRMRPPLGYAKCMNEVSYTLDAWMWNCGSSAAW